MQEYADYPGVECLGLGAIYLDELGKWYQVIDTQYYFTQDLVCTRLPEKDVPVAYRCQLLLLGVAA
jgi:hypothetical protein